jgi:hypothetical protein
LYIEQDLKYIRDIDLEEFSSVIEKVIDINWDHKSLIRHDGLSMHGKSRVIFFDHFYDKSVMDSFEKYYEQDLPSDIEAVRTLTYPLLEKILEHFPNHNYVKGEISCCFPNCFQKWHIDNRLFHKYSRRIHLPILTNKDSVLWVQENSYHLEVGKLYEFNNMVHHRSTNTGKTRRIHFILDVIDKDDYRACLDKYGNEFYDRNKVY